MEMLHLVHCLIVTRYRWLFLLSKIRSLNLVKHTSKNHENLMITNMCLIFSSFYGCWVISNFTIFHWIKIVNQICDPCCHCAAETGSWFIHILWNFKNIGLGQTCYKPLVFLLWSVQKFELWFVIKEKMKQFCQIYDNSTRPTYLSFYTL